MNIFNKVTLASLKKNKTRTIVTIIGIMLSTAMICAVTTSASSLRNYLLKNFEYQDGSWHGAMYATDSEQLEVVKNADEVKDTVYNERIGYAKVDSQNKEKPYLYIIGASDGFDELLPVHITSGTYPTNQNEILIPEHLYENGGVVYRIGDTLTLEIGDRFLAGEKLDQKQPFIDSDDKKEDFAVRETRTYTVVGFYKRPNFEPRLAPGYTAITLASDSVDNTACLDVYFTMHNAREVYSFISDSSFACDTNSDVLMLLGASRYDVFYKVLYSLAAIVITVIMFGSVSLIYNAFSISVSERTKQFGLLSSIGATKKQLRKMVLFEAFAVSIVGIPLGIILGIGGMAVTFACIGDKFAVLFSTAAGIPMEISVSYMSIIIACIVAFVTVMISAWIPSRRATRVSAVEAIRQNADIRKLDKHSKTSRLTYKLFGLPGVIASKHFKRNKKKYRTTVVSLFMSIVLFVSASSFCSYLVDSVSDVYKTYKFDIEYYFDDNDFENISISELAEAVRGEKTVTKAAYVQEYLLYCNIEKKHLDEEWLNLFAGTDIPEKDTDSTQENICIATYFVEDSAYREYLKENGLDEKLYMSKESPLAVAIDGQVRFDFTLQKYITVNTLKDKSCTAISEFMRKYDGYYFLQEFTDSNGNIICRFVNDETGSDFLDIPRNEAYESTEVNIGTTLYEYPYFVDSSADLIMLYPQSAVSSLIPDFRPVASYSLMVCSSNHTLTADAINEIFISNGLNKVDRFEYAALVQRSRDIVTIVEVFSYGFIILISLIAAANVFNTISTNISLRRREFAMLKSVGMTSKGFNRMMNYECLLYGAKALLYGLPVSIGISYLIYLSVSEGVASMYHLPIGAIAISVCSVFAVVFVTMMYSMRKIKKDNPIDALKNENL